MESELVMRMPCGRCQHIRGYHMAGLDCTVQGCVCKRWLDSESRGTVTIHPPLHFRLTEPEPSCGRAGCRHLWSMHSPDMNFCQVPDCKCPEWMEAVIPDQPEPQSEEIEDYRTAMQAFLDENVRLRVEVARLRAALNHIINTAQTAVKREKT